MKAAHLFDAAMAAVLGVGLLVAGGCVEDDRYEMNKPVMEDADTPLENDIEEGANDAVDAVVPDDPIIDAETPSGDLEVGQDPVTGETNVDVDSEHESDELMDDEQ